MAKSRSTSATGGADLRSRGVKAIAASEVVEIPGGSQASSSFGRKVSRSRSVGCGSRSFSGDFLEQISTGFSDCTMRRVESHREAKPKAIVGDDRRIKERVTCGGFFGMLSSSSSSYWISAATVANREFDNGRSSESAMASAARGRGRSWGWAAFASPTRAFKLVASSNSLVITIGGGVPATVIATTSGNPTTVATTSADGCDIVGC